MESVLEHQDLTALDDIDDCESDDSASEGLSDEEQRRRLFEHFFGRKLPDLTQADVLALCHRPDEFFYVCRKKTMSKAVCVRDLLEDSIALEVQLNSIFGHDGGGAALRPLRTEQYMSFNSFSPAFGRKCQIHVTGLHSFVIEYDKLPIARQLEMWSKSTMPFTVKSFSGGKSIHVLVRFDRELTLEEWDEITVRVVAAYPEADSSLLTDYSAYCRTPMARRDDGNNTEQLVIEVGKIVPVDEFTAWLDVTLKDVDPAEIDRLRGLRAKTRKTGPGPRSKVRRERIVADLKLAMATATSAQTETATATVASNAFDILVGQSVDSVLTPIPGCNPQTLRTLQAWWSAHADDNRPRTYKMQAAMLVALNHGCTPADVLAALHCWDVRRAWQLDHGDKGIAESLAEVVEFFELKRDAEKLVIECLRKGTIEERRILAAVKKSGALDYFGDEDEARWFIRQQRSRYHGKHPVGRIPIRNVHCDGKPVSPNLELMRGKFEKIEGGYSTRTAAGDIVFRLMEQIIDAGLNALLDLPCGSMKTTAAMLSAAARATSEARWWLVYETVDDVREKTRMLQALGCSVRAWHAYHPDHCTNAAVPKGRNAFRTAPREHCRSCEDRADCPAYHRQTAQSKWDPGDCAILVTTHVHWRQALLHNAIPDTVAHIVVDESPALSEGFELRAQDIEFLRNTLGRGNLQIFEGISGFDREVMAKLAQGDCAKIEFNIPDSLRNRVLAFLHAENSPLDDLPEDKADLVYSFLSFFRNPSLRFGVQQYQYLPNQEGYRGPLVTSFLRAEMDIACKQHTIVLDGSATVSEVKWQGFELLRCPELGRTFPNMTVDVIEAHPSQGRLGDDDCFAELREKALALAGSQPADEDLILFTNKYLEAKPKIAANVRGLMDAVTAIHPRTVGLTYGDHVGSNDGVNATACVFAMALLAPYSHYVLRAAVADEMPIEAKRIWREGEPFGNPRIGKYRYTDDAIQAAYVRSVSRDIIQATYRGCIRHDSHARYRVLVQVQGLAIIKWIERQFPEAGFNYRDRKLADAVQEGFAKARIAELAGEGRDVTVRQLQDDAKRVIDQLQFAPPDDDPGEAYG